MQNNQFVTQSNIWDNSQCEVDEETISSDSSASTKPSLIEVKNMLMLNKGLGKLDRQMSLLSDQHIRNTSGDLYVPTPPVKKHSLDVSIFNCDFFLEDDEVAPIKIQLLEIKRLKSEPLKRKWRPHPLDMSKLQSVDMMSTLVR